MSQASWGKVSLPPSHSKYPPLGPNPPSIATGTKGCKEDHDKNNYKGSDIKSRSISECSNMASGVWFLLDNGSFA